MTQHVAVVGLEASGPAIAERLLSAGFETTVHDPKRDCSALISAGASTASLPADAAEYADVVVVNAATEAAEFLFDEGGIGDTLRVGGWVIDASRTPPIHTREWHSRLASYGIGLLELVVIDDAEGTAPLLLVAGPPIDEDVVAPVLAALGRPVHVGPLGAAVARVSPSCDVPSLSSGHRGVTDWPVTHEPGRGRDPWLLLSPPGAAAERRLLRRALQQAHYCTDSMRRRWASRARK